MKTSWRSLPCFPEDILTVQHTQTEPVTMAIWSMGHGASPTGGSQVQAQSQALVQIVLAPPLGQQQQGRPFCKLGTEGHGLGVWPRPVWLARIAAGCPCPWNWGFQIKPLEWSWSPAQAQVTVCCQTQGQPRVGTRQIQCLPVLSGLTSAGPPPEPNSLERHGPTRISFRV